MSNILLSITLSGLLFLASVFLFFYGIRRKNRRSIYASLLFLVLAFGAGAWTIYIFTSKAFDKVRNITLSNPFKARTGNEIYEALFEAPAQNCVRVINNKDQIVPRLDCCIWLEFTTCPPELRRIIAQHPYKSTAYAPDYSPKPAWFKPELLGDSAIAVRHFNPDNPNRDQVLLFSKDSTHAFYCDMAD